MLVILTALFSLPAHAGTYTVSNPVYTGGTFSDMPGPGTLPYGPVTGGYGSGGGSAGATTSCSGAITSTYTWTPDYTGDAVPQSVIVTQASSASYSVRTFGTPSGSCDDGLGDSSKAATIPDGPQGSTGDAKISSGTHYSVKTGVASLVVNCSPTATAKGNINTNTVQVAYSASVSPVIINLAGVTTSNGALYLLTGQQVTATLSGIPSGSTNITYQWSAVGDTFKKYDPTATTNQYVALTGDDLKAASFSFYDKTQESLTVKCTANFTAPDGTALAVTAQSQPISVIKPKCANWDILAGDVFLRTNNNWIIYDGANDSVHGQLWKNISFAVDAPFSSSLGNGCFAQLFTPSRTALRNVTGSHKSKAVYPEPNANPVEGLDCVFPYPYNGQWSAATTGTGYDSPYQGLNPSVSNDDGGGSDWYDITANDSFKTTLMYLPPAKDGQGTVWIPIDIHTWSWYGHASKTGTWDLPDRDSHSSDHSSTTMPPQWGRVHPSPFSLVLGL